MRASNDDHISDDNDGIKLLMMTIFLMIMMVQRMRITTSIKRIQQLGRIRIRKRKGKTKTLKIRTKK